MSDLSAELANTKALMELLTESYADLAASVQRDSLLARDSLGWGTVTKEGGFTALARKQAAELADLYAVANPLIKRGLMLRTAFVWAPGPNGAGVTIKVRDDQSGQDVDAVVQEFLARNETVFTGMQAREDMERQLGIVGELFLALHTDPVTGSVSVRRIDPVEIPDDPITDPEDYAAPWLYKRVWTGQKTDEAGIPTGQTIDKTAWYPAVGWNPVARPDTVQGHPVMWDTPVLHVAVNQPSRSVRGVGDTYAALPWARLSKEFLEQTALLLKSLAKIAYRATARGDKTQEAARKIATATGGDTLVQTSGDTIEAVSKSGATINPSLVHTYQVWVAAGLGLPVTLLLGDPGATGARAVAETLTGPTNSEFDLRRSLWSTVHRRVLDHVIDAAVIATSGPLRGTVTQQGDRLVVELPAEDGRVIDIDWPDRDSTPIDVMLNALSKADSMDKLPPIWFARQILDAFGEEHPDEVLDLVTDDDGNWLPLDVITDRARQAQLDRGEQ